MKKQFTRWFLGAAVIATAITSCSKKSTEETKAADPKPNPVEEFLAPTTPMYRALVLEDFTGVRCQYCPEGHVIAKQLESDNPGRFIIIATHAGPYAVAGAGWANFTTPFGATFVTQAKVAGFPAGTISRIPAEDLGAAPQTDGGTAMNRGSWASAADNAFAYKAPVNLGAKATFDAATRLLTVKVDMYYTDDETVANNLNVGLLQDKLLSTQISTSGYMYNYAQNHVLRTYLTGQWGEVITDATTKGSKVTRTYTMTVPADYNGADANGGGAVVIDNLKVVAFVGRGKGEILNGIEVDVE